MNNVIEMQEVTWNGLKRDCDAMAEHMRVARSYWPSIAQRMTQLRLESPSDIEFGAELARHEINMNPHNQAAMIEMGKWAQEYLEDCMDNCERTSPRRFVEEIKSWGEPTYAGLVAYHTDQPEPENAPEPTESAKKDEVVEKNNTDSGDSKENTKPTTPKIDTKKLVERCKGLSIHANTTSIFRRACEAVPSMMEAMLTNEDLRYKGNNADGKLQKLSPLALVSGLPPKFAGKHGVIIKTSKNGGLTGKPKEELEKMAEDLPKYREIAEAVKDMTPRASEEAAVRLYAGKPLLVPVEKPVAESTYSLLGSSLWPMMGVENTAENVQIVECTLMFMRDWDESLAVSNKNAKGRGVTMGQRSKWLKGSCLVSGKIAIAYAQILMQHDVACCARSYTDTVMPNGHDVKAKYGL